MRTVWRFPLVTNDGQVQNVKIAVAVPKGSELLEVSGQARSFGMVPTAWYLVPDTTVEEKDVHVFLTAFPGKAFPEKLGKMESRGSIGIGMGGAITRAFVFELTGKDAGKDALPACDDKPTNLPKPKPPVESGDDDSDEDGEEPNFE